MNKIPKLPLDFETKVILKKTAVARSTLSEIMRRKQAKTSHYALIIGRKPRFSSYENNIISRNTSFFASGVKS